MEDQFVMSKVKPSNSVVNDGAFRVPRETFYGIFTEMTPEALSTISYITNIMDRQQSQCTTRRKTDSVIGWIGFWYTMAQRT